MNQPGDRNLGGVVPPEAAYITDGPVSIDQINALMRLGMNPTQVARLLGKDKSTISHIRGANRAQAFWTPTERARIYWPWGERQDEDSPPTMETKFHKATPFRRLKDHTRWYTNGVESMSYYALSHLTGFYKLLRDYDVVVAFNPELEPYANMPSGGFHFVQRTRFDTKNGRDLLIRVDDCVTAKLDEYFYGMWSFPREKIVLPPA